MLWRGKLNSSMKPAVDGKPLSATYLGSELRDRWNGRGESRLHATGRPRGNLGNRQGLVVVVTAREGEMDGMGCLA